MRLISTFRCLALAGLLCVALASCDQRPIDVVPETNTGVWRTALALETEYYADLDGISSSDIYGVASESGLIHYDGTGWIELGSPGAASLKALSVVSAGEIYAVGDNKAYRYDGATWTNFYEGEPNDRLLDIWTMDGSNVFVADRRGGVFPANPRGGVLRFDESLALVDSVYTDVSIHTVWGTSQSDVFALGYPGLIVHFDGSDWTTSNLDGNPVLFDIHGVGTTEIYTVGNLTFRRYDGSRWSPIELPEEIRDVRVVWAAAPNDVHLFSVHGPVVHFDGSRFETMNSTTDQYLGAVWGASPDDLIAVGANKKTIRFDGTKWASVSGGLPSRSRLLWGIDSRNIYFVNLYTVFRYDGATVEELPRADDVTPISAVWGASPDDLVTVGRDGAIFHFDGAGWTEAASPTTVDLNAVTGRGGAPRYAVGDSRTVVQYDGSQWVLIKEDPGSGVAYHDVWAGDGTVYVVGEGGSASRFNGVVWEAFDTGVEGGLYSVWGTAADNVYAAGEEAVLRFDGNTWNREVMDSNINRSGRYGLLAGSGRNNVFVALENYKFFHFNGELWSPAGNNLGDYFEDSWVDENGKLYAVTLRERSLVVMQR